MNAFDSTIEYRPIPNFFGYYAGTDGSLWSYWKTSPRGRELSDRARLLKPSVQKNRNPGRRYLYLNLTDIKTGKVKTRLVHQVILETFVGPCPEGMECRHLDGNPANNNLTNICWGTPAQNREDNHKNNIYDRGERHPMCKLTDAQVGEIRRRYDAGGVLQRELGEEFKVTSSQISHIVNQKSRKRISN